MAPTFYLTISDNVLSRFGVISSNFALRETPEKYKTLEQVTPKLESHSTSNYFYNTTLKVLLTNSLFLLNFFQQGLLDRLILKRRTILQLSGYNCFMSQMPFMLEALC